MADKVMGGVVSTVSRRRLADDTYRALRNVLTSGEFEPGARLLVDVLAERLDVSPTPIREALARLVDDGLVRQRPRQGYLVSDLLDRGALEELYAVRLRLEPWAAARVAASWSGDDLDRLREILDSVPEMAGGLPYSAYQQMAIIDEAFHDEIHRLSGVDLVRNILQRLIPQLRLFHAYSQSGAREKAWKEHRKVADAIAARRPDEAEAAMTEHLERALERIRTLVDGAEPAGSE